MHGHGRQQSVSEALEFGCNPIEAPTKFELVINMKTGLASPEAFLLRAGGTDRMNAIGRLWLKSWAYNVYHSANGGMAGWVQPVCKRALAKALIFSVAFSGRALRVPLVFESPQLRRKFYVLKERRSFRAARVRLDPAAKLLARQDCTPKQTWDPHIGERRAGQPSAFRQPSSITPFDWRVAGGDQEDRRRPRARLAAPRHQGPVSILGRSARWSGW